MRGPLTLLLATATATVAVAGIGLSATPALASRSAPADQVINLTFPVTGSPARAGQHHNPDAGQADARLTPAG